MIGASLLESPVVLERLLESLFEILLESLLDTLLQKPPLRELRFGRSRVFHGKLLADGKL